MASTPITSWPIEGAKVETVTDFCFLGSKITADGDKPKQCVEKQRHHSANKGPYSQGYGLPSGHVQL